MHKLLAARFHRYVHPVVITEGEYSSERLDRNRFWIVVCAIVGVTAAVIAGAFSEWPMPNALGIAGLWLVFCAALWWLFGSGKAGPIGLSATSKAWFKSVLEPYRRRH